LVKKSIIRDINITHVIPLVVKCKCYK